MKADTVNIILPQKPEPILIVPISLQQESEGMMAWKIKARTQTAARALGAIVLFGLIVFIFEWVLSQGSLTISRTMARVLVVSIAAIAASVFLVFSSMQVFWQAKHDPVLTLIFDDVSATLSSQSQKMDLADVSEYRLVKSAIVRKRGRFNQPMSICQLQVLRGERNTEHQVWVSIAQSEQPAVLNKIHKQICCILADKYDVVPPLLSTHSVPRKEWLLTDTCGRAFKKFIPL